MRMLKWALVFGVLSIIAGVFGYYDASAAFAGVAKFLFAVFLVICLVLLGAALWIGRALRR